MKIRTVSPQSSSKSIRPRPSILLAMDWQDLRVYRGIARYAREREWHLSPYLLNGYFIPQGWPGDGAITCYGKHLAGFIDSLSIPKVDISFENLPTPTPRVQVDNRQVARLAVEHFLARGYQHFAAYLWPGLVVNELRVQAFTTELRAAGIPTEQIHSIRQTPGRFLGLWEKHQRHILHQLRSLPRPLAVFVPQDNLGATLIEICARNAIHVPEELAILGVDDVEILCQFTPVPMSSVDTRLEELGYRAAERLEQLMNGELGPEAPPVIISPKEVVERRSTDVLAISHPAVVQAVQFIKQSFSEPITLDEIVAQVGLSKRGLEKAFLKHLGLTPAAELRRVRLDHAKRLLTESNDKVEAIAFACGYSNSSNLSFAFRKETGMSPRRYRLRFGA